MTDSIVARELSRLPIDDELGDIVAALRVAPAVVIHAPPGAGKTTRVPPAILDAGLAGGSKVIVLQPRRVAARASAVRVTAERGGVLGDEIGYQVRFESRVSVSTRIAFMTEGVLLRRLLDEPFLPDVSVVIFDEFHERSLASDLALSMVRQIQQSVRPDLKIVVMSATLAAQPIAKYLANCPVIESQGRTFPVEIRYWPQLDRRPLSDVVAQAIEQTIAATPGDCLVFLPGVGEIRQCQRRLEAIGLGQDCALMPLYGDLAADEQDAVLAANARRKIILSTNVAETSLTIDGVTCVIDSGLSRSLRYDDRTGLDRLELGPICRASADQRAGRAGRTQAGVCLRLWPEATQRARPSFELPEIERVDLAGAILQVLCWIEPDLNSFPWFEPPPAGALERAKSLLTRLGAANETGITPLGRRIADLPVHPRIGRLLMEGQQLGVGKQAALAAALLSERDPFIRQTREYGERRTAQHRSRSDTLDRVHAMELYEDSGRIETEAGTLSTSAAKHILRTRDQLLRLLKPGRERAAGDNVSDTSFLRSLLAAYPDRVAVAREAGSRRGLMVGGRGVRLADEVALADENLYLCIDVDGQTTEALVRQASAINRDWLPAEWVSTVQRVDFDPATERITCLRQVTYDGLVLEEAQAGAPGDAEISQALVEAASSRLDRAIPADNDEVTSFRSRVDFLAQAMPDLKLPIIGEAELRELLPQLVPGCRSFADLRRAPWLGVMKGLFSWQQLQTIDREAPERIEVPSGSHIAVQYEAGRPPILAVRIQEVFGMRETPRVAGGRIAVLMHLLAPNMRVAQITDDLASFWANTYSMVRKDLRARYPKHSWPEDPYTAEAQRRPKRKQT
jgi:ATP-dependent helicase HrpB